jgi:2'-5' RNA ligase
MLDRLKEALSRQGVRFTATDKIHLTVRFLGNVDEDRFPEAVSALAANLAGMQAPELTVAGLGAFPSANRPGIVWAGVQGDIALLHSRTTEATDDFAEKEETKPYHPHLTLARVSPPSQKVGRALQPLLAEFGDEVLARWTPTELVLVQTMPGGQYETRAAFPLVRTPS